MKHHKHLYRHFFRMCVICGYKPTDKEWAKIKDKLGLVVARTRSIDVKVQVIR